MTPAAGEEENDGKNEGRREQREHRGSDRQLDRRDMDRHDRTGAKERETEMIRKMR